MASATDAGAVDSIGSSALLTGVAAGLVGAAVTGVVLQFALAPAVLSEGIPAGFGLSGLAAGWVVFLGIGIVLGLVYTALARVDWIGAYASVPGTGAPLGLIYGLVIWVVAVIAVPLWLGAGTGGIGDYAVNLHGVLSFALLGVVIGVIYGASPYT